MTVKRRWFTYTVFLLGVGMSLQLVVSYAVQRGGARYGAKSWIGAATTVGVDAELRASVSELTAFAERIASSPAVRDETGAELERAIAGQLAAARGVHGFWALVDANGKVARTSEEACKSGIERRLRDGRWSSGPMIACDGAAVLATFRPLAGDRWRGLVLGWMIDDAYAKRFSAVANAEILFYVDGVRRGSSLLDVRGAPIPLHVAPSALEETSRTGDLVFRSDGEAPETYRGYGPSDKDLFPIERGGDWYYGAQRLASEENLVLVVAVPVAWMILAAKYSATVTACLSFVLLVMMGALVRHLVSRFSDPLVALTESAKLVADGDLSREVPEPRDREMREFCQTYNTMLRSMRELLALRQKLAREAGMADIANGVMHNIGNVLNSVNVSMSLARDSVEGSRVAGVGKLSKLIDQHAGDLGSFLTSDARGRKIPDYLRSLSTELERERQTLGRELANASASIEHVKRIVGAQQRYARPGSLVEHCVLAEVLEDALRMSSATLANHGITLDCDVASTDLLVDRHKLLQILVNLLTNAKQALVEHERPDQAGPITKRIVVTSELLEGDRVRVTVRDNGVGIAPEHHSRVFTQGFTTKPHGHGIGLHNCAIAAAGMSGRLSFESAGAGQGAAFSLELPLHPPSGVAFSAIAPSGSSSIDVVSA